MQSTVNQNELLHLFIQLNDLEQQSIVHLIKTFVESKAHKFSQSLEDYNLELETALNEVEAGIFVSHDDVVKQYINK